MRFWDSSALVPLLVQEARSLAVSALVDDDPSMIVWWASRVECGSTVHRLRREGVFSAEDAARLPGRLADALDAGDEIQPGGELADLALRLPAAHPLRAAGALQLGAALVWARGRPMGHRLVTLDDHLRTAATLEGFTVVPTSA